MKTSETLNKAADLIERYGWIRGAYTNQYGYCLIGSLREVTGFDIAQKEFRCNFIDRIPDEVHESFSNAYEALMPHCWNDIITWNDSSCKNGREAVNLLRMAAARYRIHELEREQPVVSTVVTLVVNDPELEPA